MVSPITTHVLDTTHGTPGRGIAVRLEIARGSDQWAELARGVTDDDGRIGQFSPPLTLLETEIYRLRFATGAYFNAMGIHAFYPEVHVLIQIDDAARRYHIPLLLSPFGFSTYRGS